MMPESVVCWLWKPSPRYRSQFSSETVNVLYRMVQRHFRHPHRFICVTDIPSGIDPNVEIVSAWNDYADVPSPHGGHNPSCYRRIRAFHPDIAQVFGRRFVSLDLDTVITGDLTPLLDRPEDFVAWQETDKRNFYNGSLWMMTAGARPNVWESFNPRTSPSAAKAAGHFGSDQAIFSHVLGKGEATWSTADGVYSFNIHLRNKGGPVKPLPADARIVMWHGGQDPWGPVGQQLAWVREHYQ